ncbi:MAG: hypothetical protein IKH54_06150 [Bacilli bacterium]|nr:hypothetical protein [Bacilli bacterium]
MKKLMIICSSNFYNRIPPIKEVLEKKYELIMPNGYGEEENDEEYSNMSDEEYMSFFKKMFHMSRNKIKDVDACLVLNFDKNKRGTTYYNYIGASTFLEMYEAFMGDKTIYLYNDLPDKNNMLYDEIRGFNPVILNGDLNKIK